MATPLTASAFAAALRAEGVRVVEVGDWRTHNRNHKGAWGPVHGVMSERDAQRFWTKVTLPAASDGCLVWAAFRDRRGYGKFRLGGREGRVEFAHRVAYRALVGDIPDGLVLDHVCRNPSCVRPDHLEPVPQAENVRRGEAGAHHAMKTHCPAGHPYAGGNLYVRRHPSGATNRICRTCKNARERAKRAQRKEAAA